MATYIDNIVKFHTFSKSPVSKDTTLGGAVNPSGHTVTTSQVRAQDIPAFLNTFQGTKEQAITWLGNNYPTPAHNDIVFYGGEFKAGFSTPKCLIYVSKQEVDDELVDLPSEQCGWQDFDITTAATLKNSEGKDVIAVHQNCTTVFVDGSNNAATNSNRNSLFVKRADGSILDHFVASTDKIVAGMPSLGYNALVLWNSAAIDEGELDANYIGNTFAGIVHLNKQYSTGDDAKFKVTCFEYIGDKLDTALGDIDGKIQDIVGTTMEGVVASVGTTTAAQNAGISVDSSTKTSPKIDITTGTVGGDSDAKLVTGSAVKTYVDSATAKATVSAEGVITTGDETKLVTATGAQNIAKKAASDEITAAVADGSVIDTRIDEVISDATLTDGQKIADTTETSKLVTVEQVKEYVTENAQVTVTVGETDVTSTGFEFAGSAGADVSVAAEMDENGKVTYSATLSKATVDATTGAITNDSGSLAVSATDAKTIVDKAISAAVTDGSIIDNRIDEVLSANTATLTTDNTIKEGDESKFVTASDAEKLANKAISVSLAGTTDGTIGKAISDVATTANSAVQSVTLADGSSTLLTVTDGTDVTISLSTEVATKSDAATAASDAITTSLAGTTDGTIGYAVADAKKAGTDAAAALETAKEQTLAQTGTLSGMFSVTTAGTVGTGITGITISDNGLSDAIAGAKTDAVATVKALTLTASDSDDAGKVTVALGGTVETPTITVTSSDIASAQTLSELSSKVNTHIEEAAGLYLSVEKVTALPEGDDRKTNKIYLLPLDTEAGREQNIHTEYIWTGSAWEVIGTTAIDINSLEAAAKAAQDAADTAQGEVDALEGVVAALQQTHATDKAELDAELSAMTQIITSLNGEVDGIDTRLTTAESTITALTEGENSVDSKIQTAINALDGGGSSAGVEVTQVDGVVTAVVVTPGSIAENDASVVTGGAVYTAIKAVSDLVGTTAVATQISNAIAALDSTETGDGITVTLTDGKVTAVSAAAGEVVENNTDVVTGGVVYTAVKEVKTIAEAKISAVQNDSTHFGSPLVTTSGTTVTVSPAKEWSVGTTKPASTITSVINGKMSDGSTIDDANLIDGTSMFANNTALKTYVGDLSKLTIGTHMFSGCTGLTTFVGDLSSLTKGDGMFNGCPLSVESFMYIVNSLPMATDPSSNALAISVVPLEGEDESLVDDLDSELQNKGWSRSR